MNTQRITISIPTDVYALLSQHVSFGNVSQYISETIHSRLVGETMKKKLKKDVVKEFLGIRNITKKRATQHILNAIHKGRRMGAA